MATDMRSLWHATHQIRRFAPLTREMDVDVAVIGGGITGLTAAVLLARAGRQVALLEAEHIGAGETGQTTSHLTAAVDGRYQTLRRSFGEDGAAAVAASSREAIDRIEQFCRESAGDCGFARVPGYLYAERQDDVEWLAKELDAAARAGCAVEWVDAVPVPFKTAGGILWQNQAQLHATAYLELLLTEAERHSVRIVEQTRATNVHDASGDDSCIVHTDRFDVRARDVFVAANVPVNNRVFLNTKIAAYRSYVLAFDVTGVRAPTIEAAGLFWDTEHPYHYTRVHRAADRVYLIVGGEDHRTGLESDTEAHYARLQEYSAARFGSLPLRYRWSGQIIEPVDGLPYIGRNSGCAHVYVATGYSGNGMTFGTLAAMIVTDLILARPNPYAALYDATRVKPLAGAVDYVSENVVFPGHLAADRLTSHDVEKGAPDVLRPGEGGVFAGEEGKVAVCRDTAGALHAVSAVCTHLGCDVAWNNAEGTWDCPCHGSRFSAEGKVINGPAVMDLKTVRVPVKVT